MKKYRAKKRGNKAIVIIAFIILSVLGVAGFYLINRTNNLSGERASAGSVNTVTLDGYKLTIEPASALAADLAWGREREMKWNYEITGPGLVCHTPKILINGENKTDSQEEQQADVQAILEGETPTDKTNIEVAITEAEAKAIAPRPENVIHLAFQEVTCTEEQKRVRPTNVSLKGSISAKGLSSYKYVVSYTSTARTTKKDALTFQYQGFTLSSTNTFAKRDQLIGAPETIGKTYTIKGADTNCYTASTWGGAEYNDSSDATKKTHFNGTYVLRLLKKGSSPAGCEKTTKNINLSKKLSIPDSKTATPRLVVRYVSNGILKLGERRYEGVPTVEKPAKITHNGFNLTYYYIGNNKWVYTVSGTLSNSCFQPVVKTTSNRKNPETVSVILSQTKDVTKCTSSVPVPFSKLGTVTASQFASFAFRSDFAATTKPAVNTKTLKSNGFTFSYGYAGNNIWTYKVTGKLSASCNNAVVKATSNRKMPETVQVSLTQTESPNCYNKDSGTSFTKSGKISASSGATFGFTAK